MVNYPKISIVTPSFNQGQYIEQTIQSVLDQNYPNLEYIIIDGGSTDETVDIIKKYESKITYWVSENDTGQTDAINKGFAKCTGDIFNWINSDDYYEPDSFFKLAKYFIENPDINVVSGREWGFNDIQPQEKILYEGSVVAKNVYETIRIGIIDQPCTFWRKAVIDDFFPLDIGTRYVMDRQLWWSYLLHYGQQQIHQSLDIFTHFRLHPKSKSISDGTLFETDFDRLKYSLFKQLNAPDILISQLPKEIDPADIKWKIGRLQPNHILASFAIFYAKRSYVNDDWCMTAALMRWIKKWKGLRMNADEFKLWIAVVLLPRPILKKLKQLKKRSAFCV